MKTYPKSLAWVPGTWATVQVSIQDILDYLEKEQLVEDVSSFAIHGGKMTFSEGATQPNGWYRVNLQFVSSQNISDAVIDYSWYKGDFSFRLNTESLFPMPIYVDQSVLSTGYFTFGIYTPAASAGTLIAYLYFYYSMK